MLVAAACGRDHSWATGASRVSGLAIGVGDRISSLCGICAAWLIGLPRRAGARLYATNDAEARWWVWRVTERYAGLTRQYGDARFEALRKDPTLRRDELRDELADPRLAAPRADRVLDGDR